MLSYETISLMPLVIYHFPGSLTVKTVTSKPPLKQGVYLSNLMLILREVAFWFILVCPAEFNVYGFLDNFNLPHKSMS